MARAVDFGDALRKGLRFSVEPRRWLPLFVMDAAALGIILYTFLANMGGFVDLLVEAEGDAMAWAQFSGMILWLVLGALVWYVIRMWVMGSLVHQSMRPKEFDKAYRISLSRLHKIIVAVIIVSLISGLVGAIPLAGWVLSFVVSIALFFVIQGVVLDDLGVISTLKNSWMMFRKKPLDVFVSWFLIALVSSLILGLFAIPLLASFFGLFIGAMGPSGMVDPGVLALFFVYLQENAALVFVTGLIAVLGMDISQVFAIKAQTEVYLQMRKKFPSIIKAFSKKAGNFF